MFTYYDFIYQWFNAGYTSVPILWVSTFDLEVDDGGHFARGGCFLFRRRCYRSGRGAGQRPERWSVRRWHRHPLARGHHCQPAIGPGGLVLDGRRGPPSYSVHIRLLFDVAHCEQQLLVRRHDVSKRHFRYYGLDVGWRVVLDGHLPRAHFLPHADVHRLRYEAQFLSV